eukprot:scaffold3942_cov123-Isochrysis_galbana.AAC.12
MFDEEETAGETWRGVYSATAKLAYKQGVAQAVRAFAAQREAVACGRGIAVATAAQLRDVGWWVEVEMASARRRRAAGWLGCVVRCGGMGGYSGVAVVDRMVVFVVVCVPERE